MRGEPSPRWLARRGSSPWTGRRRSDRATIGRLATLDVRSMSPTIFRERGLRFFFFSREESRIHVHVQHASGEAKFWLDPVVEVAFNHGLSRAHLTTAARLIREHEHEIRSAWARHFGS